MAVCSSEWPKVTSFALVNEAIPIILIKVHDTAWDSTHAQLKNTRMASVGTSFSSEWTKLLQILYLETKLLDFIFIDGTNFVGFHFY